MRIVSKPSACGLAFALGLALLGATPARAGIDFVDQFRTKSITQTGDGPSLVDRGYYFATRLWADAPNEYSDVSMAGPVGSVPLSLDAVDPTVYSYASPLYATQGEMDAAFPVGNGELYTYTAVGAGGTDTATLTTDFIDYPQSNPYLTGTNYSDLQGMDASQAFAFTFSAFDTGGEADLSFIFFTIFDYTTNAFVFDAGFLDPATAGLTLAGGTLQAGHDYGYELTFSNRDLIDSTGTAFSSQLGFDYRTQGRFTTSAVPEPSTLALAAIGAAAAALYGRRARRAGR